jgi:hypothetical protein
VRGAWGRKIGRGLGRKRGEVREVRGDREEIKLK